MFSETQLLSMALGFFRLSGFLVTSPFPGVLVPAPVRILLAGGLTVLVSEQPNIAAASMSYTTVIMEFLLGLGCGALLGMALSTFTFAGEAVGQQMGLGALKLFNPEIGEGLTVIGNAYTILAMSLFLLARGPESILSFLSRSFELVPPGQFVFEPATALRIASETGASLLREGMRAAAPLITAVFAAQMILAVLARSVPTLNLFVEGPSLTIASGIIGMLATVHTFGTLVEDIFLRHFEMIAGWLVR